MYKFLLYYLVIISIFGCSSVAMRPVPKAAVEADSYNIGVVQEKTVGEVMVYRARGSRYPVFTAITSFTIPGYMGVSYPPVVQGQVYVPLFTTEDGSFVCPNPHGLSPVGLFGDPIKASFCLIIDKNGVPYGDSNCRTSFIREWSVKPVEPIFKMEEQYSKDSFKQEIIYNGKSKDAIKMQYREYKEQFARPAFFQELSYDLSESRVIGFRGMTIEVLDATNSFIKFIVKKPMN